jgi:hypothetical protein
MSDFGPLRMASRAHLVFCLIWGSLALADEGQTGTPPPPPAPGSVAGTVGSSFTKPGNTPVSPSVAPSATASGDEQVDLKIKGLEEQVNDLKEKIFRTKSRLLLLQESVLGGDISSSAKAVIYANNEMGSSFVLESATYTLDGAPIFNKIDNGGDLADKPSFEIFNGLIVPGNHQISVRLAYRGHGFGLFTYLEGYKFKVQSSYTFNAEPGRLTVVKVVGFEKGGITTELKDKPAVRYDVEVSKEKPAPETAAAAPGAPGAPANAGPPAPPGSVTGQ